MKVETISDEIEKVIFTNEQIIARLQEIAAQIDSDYAGQGDLLVLGVLRGAAPIMTTLSNMLETNVQLDYIALSSYQDSLVTSGKIIVEKDVTADIQGKNVIVIDDIFESGNTLAWLKARLEKLGAKSVNFMVLLEKVNMHKHKLDVKYVGFKLEENEFLVGFGLDFKQKYRNLDSIAVLSPKIYATAIATESTK